MTKRCSKLGDAIESAGAFKRFFGPCYYDQFSEEELNYAFELIDKDGDGRISASDLDALFAQIGWQHRFNAHKVSDDR